MTIQEPGQGGSGQQYQVSQWVEPIHVRGIGRELMDLTEQVEQVSQRLLGVLSGQLEHLVQKLLSEISGGNCKIAILGPRKSGKSTLINSLIGNNDILPVNASPVVPSTSAVTRIHMGRPGAPTNGFQAHFFNKDEWDNVLKKGSTRDRGAQKHLSKIPMELFEKHSSVISDRVRHRLGDEFEMLLGRGHSFEQSNKKILEQYIAAGAETHESRPSSDMGKYSDITKYADLFLPKKPFAFPVTMIDTPSTDDPLLMRDEITRQNLQADIFILVLTAEQPLSDADLSLIRILHGLRKERLVIFVNRIDELSFVSADAESIFHYVKHQIDHEFPGYNIPIILGSAHWSNMSLRTTDHIDYAGLNRSLLPYAKEVGVVSSDNNIILQEGYPIDRKYLAYILEFASGMPRLSNVISAQMLTSKHAANLAKVVRTLSTVTRGVMATARQRVEEDLSGSIGSTEVAVSNASIKSNQDLSTSIEETRQIIMSMKQQINARIQNNLGKTSDELEDKLQNFVEGQAYELRQVIKSVNHIDKWYVNVAALRHEIEVCCNEHFAKLKKDFHEQQQQAFVKLKEVFNETYGVSKDDIHTSPVVIGSWEMPLDALSQVVALDLKGNWWGFMQSEKATIEAKCDKLGKQIRKDFSPIIKELLKNADEELQKYLNNLIEQLLATATGVLEATQQQQKTALPTSEIKYLASREPALETASAGTQVSADYHSAVELFNECKEIEARLNELEHLCLKPFKLSDSEAP